MTQAASAHIVVAQLRQQVIKCIFLKVWPQDAIPRRASSLCTIVRSPGMIATADICRHKMTLYMCVRVPIHVL